MCAPRTFSTVDDRGGGGVCAFRLLKHLRRPNVLSRDRVSVVSHKHLDTAAQRTALCTSHTLTCCRRTLARSSSPPKKRKKRNNNIRKWNSINSVANHSHSANSLVSSRSKVKQKRLTFAFVFAVFVRSHTFNEIECENEWKIMFECDDGIFLFASKRTVGRRRRH